MEQEVKSQTFLPGWYYFGLTKEVGQGKIYTHHFFNKPFISVRSSQGKISIFDAYCPHLGAHLGKGGKFKRDQITCPFHGWQFNTEGKCINIPYCQKIPKRAELISYPVVEKNSQIFIGINEAQNYPLLSKEEPIKVILSTKILANLFELYVNLLLQEQFEIKAEGPGLFLGKTPIKPNWVVLFTKTPIDAAYILMSVGVAPLKSRVSFKNYCEQLSLQKKLTSLFKEACLK